MYLRGDDALGLGSLENRVGGGFAKQPDDSNRLAVYRLLRRAGEEDRPPLAAHRQRGVRVVVQFIMSVL